MKKEKLANNSMNNTELLQEAKNHLLILADAMPRDSFLELRAFSDKSDKRNGGESYLVQVGGEDFEDNLSAAIRWADIHSRKGDGIFVGMNPRSRGDRPGSKADVKVMTAAYVDLDTAKRGISKEDAIEEVKDLSPIPPGLITDSGNGIHVTYFFEDGAREYDDWVALQEALYERFKHLGADRAVVTDSARVLRLTPFPNQKNGKMKRTRLVEFTPGVRKRFDVISEVFEASRFKNKRDRFELPETIYEGGTETGDGRNTLLFKEGAALRNRGYTEVELFEALSGINRARCIPPMSDKELRGIVESIMRYSPRASLGTSSDYDLGNFGYTLNEFLTAEFPQIEEVLYGLHHGEYGMLQAKPSIGKDQPLHSKILMADGTWKTMGEIQVGDQLASIDGRDSRVYGVFPQGEREVYRITFSDGRTAEAGAEHLWKIQRSRTLHPKTDYVVTTLDLKKIVEEGRKVNLRVSVPTVSGDFGSSSDLPVDPWLLGGLISAGHIKEAVKFSSADGEIVDRVREKVADRGLTVKHISQYDYQIVDENNRGNGLMDDLRALGLLGKGSEDKFIPRSYLTASKADRIELMQGLIDTAGYVYKTKTVQYTTTSKQLAEDVQELARSLGALAKITEKLPSYRVCYTITIFHPEGDQFVWLKRKRDRMNGIATRQPRLNVVSVEYVGKMPTQCIAVTHPDKLYITDDYVVTHNTTVGLNLSLSAALGREFYPFREAGSPIKVMYLDFENRESFLQKDIRRMSEVFSPHEREVISNNLLIVVDKELFGQPLNLSNPDHLEMVEKKAMEFGAELIIIDTMAAAFSLANENDNSEAERVVNKPLKELGRKTNAAILLIHHIGKAGDTQDKSKLYRARGASSIAAAARVIYDMDAMKDGNGQYIKNHVLLNCAKIKGKPFSDTVLELDFARRWFIPANIATPDETSTYEAIWSLITRKMGLADIQEAAREVGLELSRSTIYRALELGIANGRIEKAGYGKYAAPKSKGEAQDDVIEAEVIGEVEDGILEAEVINDDDSGNEE